MTHLTDMLLAKGMRPGKVLIAVPFIIIEPKSVADDGMS